MYRNNFNNYSNKIYSNKGYYDERGFWIPFVVGGLAGTALGYGISNNNYNNYYRPPMYYGPYPPYPFYPYY